MALKICNYVIKEAAGAKPTASFELDRAILYSFSGFFLLVSASITMPKISIPMPDQRLMFTRKDFWYIWGSEFVNIPYTVRIIPKMVNISPIGSFISSPMTFIL
jgi:hypothetical protein